MNHWVFTIGTRDWAPALNWLEQWGHLSHEMWFPGSKKPTGITAGDRGVFYGSHGHGFLGAVEVLSEIPEPQTREEDKDRWPWIMRHRLLVSKAADKNIASPEMAGMTTRRVARGPHTQISAEEYDSAVEQMLRAAARTAQR